MSYFTLTEFRTRYPEITPDNWTDAEVTAVQATAEESFEQEAGVAFTPRTTTETLNSNNNNVIVVTWPRIRSVSALTVNGTAYTPTDLANLQFNGRIIRAYTGYTGYWWMADVWDGAPAVTPGIGNVTVTYSHGWDTPPLRVKQAVMTLTRGWLVDGPFDDRATSMTTEDGTFTLTTPGLRGSMFGIPEVDQTVSAYSERSLVA